MTDITWTDPPTNPRGGRRRVWETRLAPLRERPGQWARLDDCQGKRAYNVGQQLRKGGFAGIDPTEFEAISRTVDGTVYLFVRYIGPPS